MSKGGGSCLSHLSYSETPDSEEQEDMADFLVLIEKIFYFVFAI